MRRDLALQAAQAMRHATAAMERGRERERQSYCQRAADLYAAATEARFADLLPPARVYDCVKGGER